jgi:hypothetical protein
MQGHFAGHILRRTTDSVDWKGNSLLQLPPHKVIIGVLQLTGREVEIIQKRAEDARNGQASVLILSAQVPISPFSQRRFCK